MKEIAPEMQDNAVKEFMPLAKIMLSEGRSQEEIQRLFKNHLNLKRSQFYRKNKLPMTRIGDVVNSLHLHSKAKNKSDADSQAERIFYDMLTAADIEFRFQVQIGVYRVDYLINGDLIVELDGPNHSERERRDQIRDKYLRKQGYRIMRVPLWVAQCTPEAVIDSIQEAI